MRRVRITFIAVFMIFVLICLFELPNEGNIFTNLYNYSHYKCNDTDVYTISKKYVKSFGQSPPLGFEKWVEFAMEKKCELDLSYYKQIYTDLDPWMHGKSFKSKMSDYILDSGPTRLALSAGKFRSGTSTFSADNQLFKSVAHLIKYDFEYLLNGYDEPISLPADDDRNYESMLDVISGNSCIRNISSSILNSHGFFLGPGAMSYNGMMPVLSQAKHICYKDILVPMGYHIGIAKESITDNILWSEKKNILFWRGSSTGGSNSVGKPWDKYHRTRLVDWEKNWAKNHTEFVLDTGKMSNNLEELNQTKFTNSSNYFVDIGFSRYSQIDDITRKTFKVKYPLKASVSFQKTMKFKYLLVLDGNTWPSRMQSYLQTNSVILYNGIFIDFYLWMLKPWVHYIPVRTDLEDLEEKMDWLLVNDDKAQEIAFNAKTLMSKLGRYEHLQCYTGLLMQEYGRLFGKPSISAWEWITQLETKKSNSL